MGCFHRHFQVKPEIKLHGGLTAGLDRGNHDSDYYIEIAVKNKALVQTIVTKKVGLDTCIVIYAKLFVQIQFKYFVTCRCVFLLDCCSNQWLANLISFYLRARYLANSWKISKN